MRPCLRGRKSPSLLGLATIHTTDIATDMEDTDTGMGLVEEEVCGTCLWGPHEEDVVRTMAMMRQAIHLILDCGKTAWASGRIIDRDRCGASTGIRSMKRSHRGCLTPPPDACNHLILSTLNK